MRRMNEQSEMIEIDLQKLFMRYLTKWWLIVLCGLLFAGVGLFYTANFITPMYRASVTLYVNNVRAGNQVESISSSSLSSSKQLVQTYIKIISSDTVLTKVIEEAECEYSVEYVRNLISATQVDETELFKVHISHHDPEMAAHLANAVAEVIPTEMAAIVEGSSTKIIDYATVPQYRYTPSYTKNTVFSAILGCVLVVTIITIQFLLDVRIKEAEDLMSQYDYPILGQIPNFEQVSTKRSHKSGYGYGYDTAKTAEKAEKKEG